MAGDTADEPFERLVPKLVPGGRLLESRALTGGVSARLTALELERPGGARQTLVVRRHGEADLARDPDVAEHEFRLLQALRAEGLPTPAPYHVDQSGGVLPTPFIVIEHIDGEPESSPADLADFVRQLAAVLVAIHAVDHTALELAFLRRQAALPAVTLVRPNDHVLLHGDFWPGNTLWRKGRLVGIVDWDGAALGDPLADVGNGRLELLWAFGADAMHAFTEDYRALAPTVDFTDLPAWDLTADARLTPRIPEWGLERPTVRTMLQRREAFVAEATERLATGAGT